MRPQFPGELLLGWFGPPAKRGIVGGTLDLRVRVRSPDGEHKARGRVVVVGFQAKPGLVAVKQPEPVRSPYFVSRVACVERRNRRGWNPWRAKAGAVA